VIRLDAGHDRNGNPRRVFVALDDHGNIIGCEDEGYSGNAAAKKRWPRAKWGPTFATTPGEYRSLVKLAEDTKRMMGASKRQEKRS
jgi:hypothetical protein